MFKPRPCGLTLERALHQPHPASERFDQEFPTVAQCQFCQKHVYAPRAVIRDEMKDHWANHCSARRTHADDVREARILYPRI